MDMQQAVPSGLSRVSVIIPCLDEETAIGPCVTDVRRTGVGEVIVVDGGSQDATVARARAAGAQVVIERQRGYGRAMMAGVSAASPSADILLFIDGDGSDRPELIPDVLAPLLRGEADFVMGSRVRGPRERGSLAPAQILAGYLAGALIFLRYGVRFTDMSPFRAISRAALDRLGMQETTFGWNLEMQMRAVAAGLRIREIPVGQRRRVGGTSKVSGNLVTAIRVVGVLAKTFVRLALQIDAAAMAPQAKRP